MIRDRCDQPAIDLAQALAAVNVVAVFRAIAVRCGPGNRLDELRPLDPEQLVIFARESARIPAE